MRYETLARTPGGVIVHVEGLNVGIEGPAIGNLTETWKVLLDEREWLELLASYRAWLWDYDSPVWKGDHLELRAAPDGFELCNVTGKGLAIPVQDMRQLVALAELAERLAQRQQLRDLHEHQLETIRTNHLFLQEIATGVEELLEGRDGAPLVAFYGTHPAPGAVQVAGAPAPGAPESSQWVAWVQVDLREELERHSPGNFNSVELDTINAAIPAVFRPFRFQNWEQLVEELSRTHTGKLVWMTRGLITGGRPWGAELAESPAMAGPEPCQRCDSRSWIWKSSKGCSECRGTQQEL